MTTETQELRLATAMTGGVSLAIWMGGVARELNLLQLASREREAGVPIVGDTPNPDDQVGVLYRRMLELLDMTVAVDVLAGTSAGGINAPLLALARVNDLDLGCLRDIWIKVGSFEGLLRDPEHDKPSSLLQGDNVLLRGISDGIDKIWRSQRATPLGTAPKTRVFMTTTLLEGETSRFTDAFGTLVQDVDHQGMFTFDEEDLAKKDTRDALATAGRSSASYPFAFEPGFVSHKGEGQGADSRPAMAPFSNMTRSHWVADGGLLMNRPIGPILQEIFDRPAERHVRRVLLYVVPSPGHDPDPTAEPEAATLGKPMALPTALGKDAGALISQSIGADLRSFREHNDRVDALVDTRLRMAELATKLTAASGESDDKPLPLPTPAMLDDHHVRQSDCVVRPLVRALMRAITTLPRDKLPPVWAAQLAPGMSPEAGCRAAAAAEVSAGWDRDAVDIPFPAYTAIASYGPDPFDGARATVIAMLRAAFTLTDRPGIDRITARDMRVELGAALKEVHDALTVARPRVQRLVAGEVDAQVERDRIAAAETPTGSREPVTDQAQPTLEELAATITRTYLEELPTAAQLAQAWRGVTDQVKKVWQLLTELTRGATPAPSRTMAPLERSAAELRTYLAYLGAAPDANRIAASLFQLHVATRSVLPVSVQVEQVVELVQLSADTRNLLDIDRRTAKDKLTGMQLVHFGAFYKPSWRASDWTWGRVDGAGWLVHLMLDPRRIRTITEREQSGVGTAASQAKWFFGELCNRVLGTPPPADYPSPQIGGEIESIFADGKEPASLPHLALWLAQSWQHRVAAAELPKVAEYMDDTSSWAIQVKQAGLEAAIGGTSDTFGRLLASCPVPDEKLGADVGTALFTRTITKTLGVAGAMLDGVPRNAPFIGSTVTTVRTVTLAVYRAARATGGRDRPLLAIGALLAVLGITAGASDSGTFGTIGVGSLALGLSLVALATWRGNIRKTWAALAGGLVVAGVVLVVGPLRDEIFGKGTCTDAACKRGELGWFGKDLLPWLGAKPMHVLIVLVLVAALIGAAAAFFGRKREGAPVDAADGARDTRGLVTGIGLGVVVGVVGAAIDAYPAWIPLAVTAVAAVPRAADAFGFGVFPDARAHEARPVGPRRRKRRGKRPAARELPSQSSTTSAVEPLPREPVTGRGQRQRLASAPEGVASEAVVTPRPIAPERGRWRRIMDGSTLVGAAASVVQAFVPFVT